MKSKKVLLFLPAVILMSCSSAFSQKFLGMMEDPSVNFFEVQKEAYSYFETHMDKEKLEKEKKAGDENEEEGGLYNLFKRWESNMQYYIDEQGNRISTKYIDETTE